MGIYLHRTSHYENLNYDSLLFVQCLEYDLHHFIAIKLFSIRFILSIEIRFAINFNEIFI